MKLLNRAVISKCNTIDMVLFLWMVMDVLIPVRAIDLARPQVVQNILKQSINTQII